MVNADRDKSEPMKWVECKSCDVSLVASGAGRPFWLRHNADHSHTIVYTREPGALSATERPADAGTPPSAPAPSQAATEAHSDENEALCAFTVHDGDGDEQPCDRPATGWRWYQGHAHEDMLDVACFLHENEGGRRLHAAEAKVARVEALCDDWDRVVTAESIRAALAGPATEEGA